MYVLLVCMYTIHNYVWCKEYGFFLYSIYAIYADFWQNKLNIITMRCCVFVLQFDNLMDEVRYFFSGFSA